LHFRGRGTALRVLARGFEADLLLALPDSRASSVSDESAFLGKVPTGGLAKWGLLIGHCSRSSESGTSSSVAAGPEPNFSGLPHRSDADARSARGTHRADPSLDRRSEANCRHDGEIAPSNRARNDRLSADRASFSSRSLTTRLEWARSNERNSADWRTPSFRTGFRTNGAITEAPRSPVRSTLDDASHDDLLTMVAPARRTYTPKGPKAQILEIRAKSVKSGTL